MQALTPEERRGVLMLALLLALGAAYDLVRARAPAPAPPAGDARAFDPASVPAAPARGPEAAAAGGPDAADAPLDLNRAGVSELESLPGIGPVLARRIVEHRAVHGPFRSPEELRAVRGVGPRLMARLAGRVTAGPVDSARSAPRGPDSIGR
jgi:competence ComEA-like helix-hairpin-helix protein